MLKHKKVFEQLRLLWQRRKHLSPAQLVVLSFALAILVGTFFLALPIAHAPDQRVTLFDAFFTATSAVCVTGLAVVDTGRAYNAFGQSVILLLIQAGGLGIITLGTLTALLSGRRIGFRERMNLKTQINTAQVGGVLMLIRRIVFLVFTIELLGALLLYAHFVQEGQGIGIFYALFHSISAFNNAGFSLYSDSLSSLVANPLINVTIMGLIILGSLGFPVIFELLLRFWKQRRAPLTLHTQMVLLSTAFLIGVGTLLILLFEWTNPLTLGPLTYSGKFLASLFQSVTPRTAGFNTVDYGAMRGGTLVLTLLLMFIGGSPGSTAGGIKTVTFFVLMVSAWHVARGERELTLLKRRLSLDIVIKAGVIALFGIMISGAALTLLAFTDAHLDRFDLAFEVISAVSTVGLSVGITAELSGLGKLVIILLMYLGRLGPLTFALALIAQPTKRRIEYPVEDVVIG